MAGALKLITQRYDTSGPATMVGLGVNSWYATLTQKPKRLKKSKRNAAQSGDDQLTNLSWLQSIDISIDSDISKIFSERAGKRRAEVIFPESDKLLDLPNSVRSAQQRSHQSRQRAALMRHNPNLKPPYSYSTMICMAMRDSPSGQVTLNDIYNWIKENFAHFRGDDITWQNSVRHNLSLNKCFEKLPRSKNDAGKGNYWRIRPDCVDLLEDGIIKRQVCPFCSTVLGTGIQRRRAHRFPPELEDESSAGAQRSLFGSYTGADQTQGRPRRPKEIDLSEFENSLGESTTSESNLEDSMDVDAPNNLRDGSRILTANCNDVFSRPVNSVHSPRGNDASKLLTNDRKRHKSSPKGQGKKQSRKSPGGEVPAAVKAAGCSRDATDTTTTPGFRRMMSIADPLDLSSRSMRVKRSRPPNPPPEFQRNASLDPSLLDSIFDNVNWENIIGENSVSLEELALLGDDAGFFLGDVSENSPSFDLAEGGLLDLSVTGTALLPPANWSLCTPKVEPNCSRCNTPQQFDTPAPELERTTSDPLPPPMAMGVALPASPLRASAAAVDAWPPTPPALGQYGVVYPDTTVAQIQSTGQLFSSLTRSQPFPSSLLSTSQQSTGGGFIWGVESGPTSLVDVTSVPLQSALDVPSITPVSSFDNLAKFGQRGMTADEQHLVTDRLLAEEKPVVLVPGESKYLFPENDELNLSNRSISHYLSQDSALPGLGRQRRSGFNGFECDLTLSGTYNVLLS